MSNTKHTPGPWIVASDKTSVLQVTPDTDSPFPCVVDCASGYNAMSFGEAKENARLIAAAPSMLATLQAVAAMLSIPLEHEQDLIESRARALSMARAAIAKATGTD